MSDFSKQLKAKADIARIIGEAVALKPGGSGFIGLCPFHSEKSPSFHVHSAKQFYYCFGCHAHGDIFQFVMQWKKMSFPEAVEAVAERLGIEVPRRTGGADSDPRRQPLLEIHTAAAAYFERALAARDGAPARAYLQERDLPPEVAAGFHLGYAPGTGRALALHLESQGFAPDLALRSGLCQVRRESQMRAGADDAATGAAAVGAWSDLYDRFRSRLMFPIADERGRVIAFGGRALEADAKTPKYLNSPESLLYTKGRVLYNLDRARTAIRELGYVILVEGYFDCIRVFAAGFGNVVASCGTALTSTQIGLVAPLAKKALVNFDPDAAGAAAAERSIGLLLEEDFQMRIVTLADGLDPDAFIRRQGREAYAAALKASRSFFDYLAERARRQFDLRRGEGKLGAINHLLPYLSHVQDPILRQNLAENLASQLGLDQPLISQQLLRATRERRSQLPQAPIQLPAMLPAERLLLRAWMEWEERREELAACIGEEGLLRGLATAPLAEQLLALHAEGLSWDEMTERLEPADRHLLAEILMVRQDQEPLNPEVLAGALEALRERRGAGAMRAVLAEIAAAAQAGDRTRMEALLRQKAVWDSRGRGPAPGPQGEGPRPPFASPASKR